MKLQVRDIRALADDWTAKIFQILNGSSTVAVAVKKQGDSKAVVVMLARTGSGTYFLEENSASVAEAFTEVSRKLVREILSRRRMERAKRPQTALMN